MSSKQQKHKAKMQRKRAIKAARRTAYAALAGTSKKSKNKVTRSSVSTTYKHAHMMLDCGNPGCQKCQPRPRQHGASGLAA